LEKALEAQAVRGSKGKIASGLQLSWFHSQSQTAAVEVDMDIDPTAMRMRGELHGEIDVSGTARGEDGSVAARFGDTIEKRFETQAQLEGFLKAPYHYAKQFRVMPGRYKVRVAAGSADGAFGIAEETLDIDPWSSQALSVSGIALGMTDYPVTSAAAELDDSVLRLRGPHRLASLGRVLRPLGGTQFPAGQNGLFYFETYDSGPVQVRASWPPAARPLGLQFLILDRMSGELKIDSGASDASEWSEPGNPVTRIAPALPLSRLQPGAYTLEVRVTHDNGRDAVTRRVDFDVR
jgi:hypothetical protein